jgi:hypothetical protein
MSGNMIERVAGAAGRVAGRAQIVARRAVPDDERRLIGRAMRLPFRKKFSLARRLWRDPRMGTVARAPLVAGVAYALVPFGLTPRRLGPLRELERIVGLSALLWLLVRLAPRDALAEHLDALEQPGLWWRLRGRR